MSKQTQELTNMYPGIKKFQDNLLERYTNENRMAKKNQIVLIGSSSTEIFPIEKMQQGLNLDKIIYNRGIRATTTTDVLEQMDTLIFDLHPSKIFINIGANDIGFGVPVEVILTNYEAILKRVKSKLPDTKVYVEAYYPINPVHDFGESKQEHSALFDTRKKETLVAVNSSIANLASKYGFQFINVNTGLTDKDGNLRPELTFDGAHMFSAGYEIVLNNLKHYL